MGHPESALAQPDPAVLRRAKRGDQKAFAVIVHTYQRLVFTYVFRLVDDRRLAEDLTQDVFLRVFRGLPGFTESSAFTTWLFQITKNRVIDELRAIERRPHAVNIDDIAAPTLIEPRFEQAEPIQALWAAVGELNLDLRTALLLRDVVGLSYVEIADALEVTITTVKWRIHKARESVQAAMEQQGFGYGSTSAADAPTSSTKR
jgi:RNA polymerase sigma-70 factor, ECF subfamily